MPWKSKIGHRSGIAHQPNPVSASLTLIPIVTWDSFSTIEQTGFGLLDTEHQT